MLLQGIRRVTALTGDKALLALREGQELSSRFTAAKSLKAAELDKEITSLKQVGHRPSFGCIVRIPREMPCS